MSTEAAEDEAQAVERGQLQAAEQDAPDMNAAEAAKPDTPRGVPEVETARAGPSTYLKAIVSASGRQIRQVISGMSDAELFQVVTGGLLPADQGQLQAASSAQDFLPPAKDEGPDEGQLQASSSSQDFLPPAKDEGPNEGQLQAAADEEVGGEEALGCVEVHCVFHKSEDYEMEACSEMAIGADCDWGGIRVP